MVQDLEQTDLTPDRMNRFLNDQIRAWKDTNSEVHESNLSKATRARVGQRALLGAAIVVALLCGAALFG